MAKSDTPHIALVGASSLLGKEIKDQLAQPRWADAPSGEKEFLQKRVLGSLQESPTPGMLNRMKRNLYLLLLITPFESMVKLLIIPQQ